MTALSNAGTGSGGWGRVVYGVDLRHDGAAVVRGERMRGRVICTPIGLDDSRMRSDVAGGCAVAAGLGPRECVTQWLEVGFTSPSKVLKVLPSIFDIQLPFPLEACTYEFLGLHTAGTHARALGVASRHTEIERKLERMQAIDLDPVVLDHEGLALWTQSLAEAPASPGALRMVIHAGEDRSMLVLGTGADYRATHSVRLDDPTQWRRLIRVAGQAEGAVLQAYWCGPGATDAALRRAVCAALQGEWQVDFHELEEPDTFLARALATRLLTVGPWHCNLRTGHLAHPAGDLRVRRQAARTVGLLLAAGLMLCAANLGVMVLVNGRKAELDASFLARAQALAGPALGGARGEQALLVVRRHVAEREESLRPYVDSLAPSLVGRLDRLLRAGQGRGLALETVSLKPGQIAVVGRGPNASAAQPLVEALRAEHLAATLKLDAPLADASVPFSIQAEVPHG